MNNVLIIAAIAHTGISALRIAFTIAAIIYLLVSIFLWCRQRQSPDRDPSVEHEKVVNFVWVELVLVLLVIFYLMNP
jgi:TRAP-type C4-dicarboxylate transport system permease large subunit